MAYVRNPFSRIASGYLEKFVHEWDMKKERMEYKWLRDRILVNYRLSGDTGCSIWIDTILDRYCGYFSLVKFKSFSDFTREKCLEYRANPY